mgnify:CR=1|jgi:hypothetical protein|tara:strand:+ start:2335 stop:2628 length:294 start_codon:yes stop_codon:yes gene_type:complete
MDIFAILDQYGIPISVALAFGFFIWKQNQFIQNELMEELDERFKRLEGIVIKLIDNAKQNELKLTDLDGSVKLLLHYLAEEKAKNKEQILKKIKDWC